MTAGEAESTTYSRGGFQGSGVPGQRLPAEWADVVSVTIGADDRAGSKHHAKWYVNAVGTLVGGRGPSGAPSADTLNAAGASGGAQVKQTATLTLDIGGIGLFDLPGWVSDGSRDGRPPHAAGGARSLPDQRRTLTVADLPMLPAAS